MIEQFDLTLFGILGVVLTVINDSRGIESVVAGTRSLLIIAFVYFTLQLIVQTVEWWNFEITIEDESLSVRSGFFRIQHRTVPFSRIQQSSTFRTPVSSLFGITAFECETAGDPEEAEVTARYLDTDDAAVLQQRLPTTPDQTGDTNKDSQETVFSLSPRELVLFGCTQLQLRTVALSIGAGWLVLFTSLESLSSPRSLLIDLFSGILPLSPGLMLIIVGIGGWLVGAVLSIERLFGFQLSVEDNNFRKQHGLIRQYDADLSLARIQVARIRANPLHRVLGLVQADVGTAGISGSLPFGLHWPLAPLVETHIGWQLVERAIGRGRPTLQSIPTRARRRYLVRYSFGTLALAGGTVVLRQFIPALDLIPLGMFGGILVITPLAAHVSWTHRGYELADDCIVVRYGFWTQRTYVVPYDNIQDMTISQSPFQRRVGLISVRLDIASLPFLPGIRLSDVNESVGTTVQRRLLDENLPEEPACPS
ncbi:PH domain-containing protein [Natrinema halophilum]|uniref:PH domain-containing protein n=1 Tax=Natrinema halophilum TaxID=1699371 RepID=UPI001F355BC1|nr:PH domain-containing protein [Natrinema halophilum]QLG49720.2 PH domain-containing protein [Natrinema halophilum]